MPRFLNPITITTPGGSAPLVVNSSTVVTNLNADLLDGQHGSFYQNAGNLNAGTIPTGRLSGTYPISISGSADVVSVADTRTVTTTPQTIDRSVRFDFKENASNGLNDGGNYFGLMTFRQWGTNNDWSGGLSHQLGFTDNGNIWQRSGSSTTWGSWKKLWDDANDGAGSGLDADLLDGQHGSYYAAASSLGNYLPLTGGTLTGGLTGTTASFTGDLQSGGAIIRASASTAGQAWLSTAAYGVSQGDGRTHFGYNTGTQYENYIRGAHTVVNGSFQVVGAVTAQSTLAVTGAITQNGNQVLHAGNYSSYALPLAGGTLTGELSISTGGATGIRVNSPAGNQSFWIRVGYDTDGTATPVASALNTMLQSSGSSAGTFTIVCGNTKTATLSNTAANFAVALQQGGNQVLHAGNVSAYALPIGGGTVTGNLTINGTLSEGGYQAFPERVYTVDLTAQSAANFYPIVINGAPGSDNWHHRFSLEMPSLGGASAYNMHHFHGEARGGGWSDQTAFYRVFHNCYQDEERSVLGLWRGTQNWFGIVIYVRGGQTYYVRTNSRSVTGYTSAVTLNSATFAIKNAAGADVSGVSANIGEMFNAINTPQGFHSSYNNYIGGTQVVTNTGSWGISVTGSAASLSSGNNKVQVGTRGSWEAWQFLSNTASTSALGLYGSGGTWLGMLYAESTNIGFLDSSNSWDLRKNINGELHITVSGTARVALHAGNFSSYALPITGGSVTGPVSIIGQTVNGQSHYQWEGATFRNPGDWTASQIIRRDNATAGINGSIPALVLYNNNGGDQTTVGLSFASAEGATGQGNAVALAGIIARKEGAGTVGSWSSGSLTIYVKNVQTRVDALNITSTGTVNALVALQQDGNQVLHAGNYTSYLNNTYLRAAGHPGYNDWNVFGNTAQTVNSIFQENFNIPTSTGSSNFPTNAAYKYGTLVNFGSGGSAARAQVYISHAGNDLVFRGGWDTSNWHTWNRCLTDQNYNSYSPTLSGTGATGTWGISITGTSRGVGTSDPTIGTGGLWVTTATGLNVARNGTAYVVLDAGNYSSYSPPLAQAVYGENATATTNLSENNLDAALKSGFYTVNKVDNSKLPATSTAVNFLIHCSYVGVGNTAGIDLLTQDSTTSNLFYRNATGAGKGAWRTVLDSANYTSYAPTLTGTGASGTWGISISGSAVSATTQSKSDSSTSIATTAFSKWLFATFGTGGTTDWNHVSNTMPGTGTTLLLGNATNGFGPSQYYHPVNFEYAGTGGTGNVTQLAVAYGLEGNDLRMRGRYSGTWTSWVQFLNSSNYNSYSPTLTGGGASGTWGISISGSAAQLNGQAASFYQNAGNLNAGTLPSARLSGTYTIDIAGAASSGSRLGLWDGTSYITGSNTISGTGGRGVNLAPNTYVKQISFEFKNTSFASMGGNYGGLITIAPWDGTAVSQGDPNYQLLFSASAANSTSNPVLRLRAGIDAGWGAWATLIHDANFATAIPNSGVGAGTYNNVTVNAKGIVTGGSNVSYLTANQNIGITGDATGSGTTSIVLTLANSGVSAGTYRSVTVNAKGIVTAGTNPSTLSGYGITDALSTSGGTVNGNLTIGSGFQHLASDGTAAAPGYSFSADTNTGICRTAADTMGLVAGGIVRASIDSNGINAVNGSALLVYRDGSASISPMLYWANAANNRAYNWQLDAGNNATLWSYNGTAWASIISITSAGSLTASSFSGAGTGLTGTASSLTAGAVAWSGVTGKPTTLSGYGITDAINTSATAQTKSGDLTVGGNFVSNGTATVKSNGTRTGTALIKFAQTIGDNYATSFNVDHNLSTTDVLVQVVRLADGAIGNYTTSIVTATANRVTVTFAAAPTTSQYRVVVVG